MLRSAREADFSAVYQIYMSPAVNPFMSWEPMPADEFSLIYREFLLAGFLFVFEVENSIVAVIRMERRKYRRSHTAYLGGLAIHCEMQNQGLGKKIMLLAIDRLKNEGVTRFELVVESDNRRAIQLYERLGFVKEGVLKRFFKRDSDESFVDDYSMALLI